MSGCDRELTTHFRSAASLKYHSPDTWHDTTLSQIILTLGRPVLALPGKTEYHYKIAALSVENIGRVNVIKCIITVVSA